jgi:hypothetical protein
VRQGTPILGHAELEALLGQINTRTPTGTRNLRSVKTLLLAERTEGDRRWRL